MSAEQQQSFQHMLPRPAEQQQHALMGGPGQNGQTSFAISQQHQPPQQQQFTPQNEGNFNHMQQQMRGSFDPKAKIIGELRNMLSGLIHLDEATTHKFMQFASFYHSQAAQDITQVIIEYIVKSPDRQLEYLYIMDSILKHVQGSYIACFLVNINYIMHLVFQKARVIQDPAASKHQQSKLMKIFKTWEVLGLFPQTVINEIADKLQIRHLESQLLSNMAEMEKINHYKERLQPSQLPQEVVMSGKFICGTFINPANLRNQYMKNFNQQPQPHMQMQQLMNSQFQGSGSYPGGYPPYQQSQQFAQNNQPRGDPRYSQQQNQQQFNGQPHAYNSGYPGAGYRDIPQQAQPSGDSFNTSYSTSPNDPRQSLMNQQRQKQGSAPQKEYTADPHPVDINSPGKAAQTEGDKMASDRKNNVMSLFEQIQSLSNVKQVTTQNDQASVSPIVKRGGDGAGITQAHVGGNQADPQQQYAPQSNVVGDAMTTSNGQFHEGKASSSNKEYVGVDTQIGDQSLKFSGANQSQNRVMGGNASWPGQNQQNVSQPGHVIDKAMGNSQQHHQPNQMNFNMQAQPMQQSHMQRPSGQMGNPLQQHLMQGQSAPQQANQGYYRMHPSQQASHQHQQHALEQGAPPGQHMSQAGIKSSSASFACPSSSNFKSVGHQPSSNHAHVEQRHKPSSTQSSSRHPVSQAQFGFLPSLLKSFTSFNQSQQLSIGNFIAHNNSQADPHSRKAAAVGPSFDNLASLNQSSIFAQNEIFEGIKFKCAICGMRFVRNQTLKEHLNTHFELNLAIKKRQAGVIDRAANISREQFQNFASFVAPQKHKTKQEGLEGAHGNSMLLRNTDEMIPYDGTKSSQQGASYNFCYLCKDRLDVIQDELDEGWYFINAKQIKFRSQTGSATKAVPQRIYNVHTLCLKEIELNDKQEKRTSSSIQTGEALAGQKRSRVEYEKYEEGNAAQEWSTDLRSMIQGLQSQRKRQHVGASAKNEPSSVNQSKVKTLMTEASNVEVQINTTN